MNDYNIEFVRGDTFTFTIKLNGFEGTIASVYMSCKKYITDVEYQFQKEIGDGITINQDGTITFRVAPEDTTNLDIGDYIYDVQIGISSDIFTVLKGKLTLDHEITRVES